jgi:hypothetical protein
VPDGTADDMLCADWSSSSSNAKGLAGDTAAVSDDAGAGAWTQAVDTPCDRRAHLYCIEY